MAGHWADARQGLAMAIGLLVLAFNVLAADALPPPPHQILAPTILCTSLGPVALDRDDAAAPADGIDHGVTVCLFCLPLLHGFAQTPTAVAVAIPVPSGARIAAIPTAGSHTRPLKPLSPIAARAPPCA